MSALLARREGEVLVLTLNRPEKANALNQEMQEGLVSSLSSIDPAVKAVLLSAAGEKCFSAGADLKQFAELDRAEAAKRRRALLVRTLEAFIDLPLPLVAAVQAKALGAGLMLAALADEVVAADTAELGMPEILHGMRSPIGYAILEARCGPRLARRLVQAGEPIGVAEAAAAGLVDVGAGTSLMEKALERARALAAASGPAFAANKSFINAALRARLEEARRAADAA